MSFNFGQYIGRMEDINNYISSIEIQAKETIPPQQSGVEVKSESWVIPFTHEPVAAIFPTGDFLINGQIQPQLGKRMELKIVLITNEDQRQEIFSQTINKAEEYQSAISTIDTQIVTATLNRDNCKNTYETLKLLETSNEQRYMYAKTDWETNWEDKPDSAEKMEAYNTYLAIEQEYNKYKKDLNAASAAYLQVEQDLNNLIYQQQELLSELRVPFQKSFSSASTIYKTIQIEVSLIGDGQIPCPACSINVKQLQELLNAYIMHNPLKHIAIQTIEGTKVYINKKELIVGSNNLLEIYNKDLLITSLKIFPQSNFVIDYQY